MKQILLSTLMLFVVLFNVATANANSGNIYQFANQCYAIYLPESGNYLSKQNEHYAFSQVSKSDASKFTFRPAALGVYLFYDENKNYLAAKITTLFSVKALESEMKLNIPEKDYLLTPAEWQMYTTEHPEHFKLFNLKTKAWLTNDGLDVDEAQAAKLAFHASTRCSNFPESETGASGTISKTQHDDGSLWGFADPHEHMGGNHGFGGKVFHGAAFHKLGIEHALSDCEKHHGKDGSRDFFSITYKSGSGNISTGKMLRNLYQHFVHDEPDHATDGYPALSNWNVHQTPTHQSLYYKWIERAWLGGMRLMVEYIESAEVVCNIVKKIPTGSPGSDSCNEMDQIDHQLGKIIELQDYIDAQNGGPGKGWFRLVYSPEQAREVVKAGKLAVIIGIEIENPFDCFINEREGFAPCSEEMVRERLNAIYNKGVRAMFPSHKFVNAFSSGDGNPGILELGDYLNTGQWRDYVACEDVPGEFWMHSHAEGDKRSLFSKLADVPGIPMLNRLLSGDAAGTAQQKLPIYPKANAHCQRDGFTPLGLALIDEMMKLGMIIDLGHTPKAALNDLVPVLLANEYPAVHSHGGDQALMNLLGGISTRGLGSACRDENGNSALQQSFNEILNQVDPDSAMPRKGLSYDFNGFAGYNKPRFGKLSNCASEQQDPLPYPFTSFGGDIVFDKLQTGEMIYDFNQYGLANIGLFPDLIEEARRSGADDEAISALFRTVEAYVRIWEKAENKSKKP